MSAPADELATFARGAVDLIERGELALRLGGGRRLRVKLGLDPSSPDLHLGHMVQLLKLRDLQDLGHTIVLIVGDATAMVGDPSGRNKLRPVLSRADVERNLATYVAQASKVLDLGRAEVRQNSEWFDRLGFEGFLALCGRMTVARMLERDTFERRMAASEPIGIHEFVYPLMQGQDSVEIRADLELGGTDQLFNLLVGRQIQEQVGQTPQICLTLPLIDGLDGRKMSKSYGNAIGLLDAPRDMFGKVMSVPDEALPLWFELLTRLPAAEIAAVLAGHPRAAKARLAFEITSFLHGPAAGDDARAAFDRQFRGGEVPDDVPERDWPGADASLPLAVLLRELGFATSSSEGRRLIAQGGVRLDGVVQRDPETSVPRPAASVLLQVGKRRFARLRPR